MLDSNHYHLFSSILYCTRKVLSLLVLLIRVCSAILIASVVRPGVLGRHGHRYWWRHSNSFLCFRLVPLPLHCSALSYPFPSFFVFCFLFPVFIIEEVLCVTREFAIHVCCSNSDYPEGRTCQLARKPSSQYHIGKMVCALSFAPGVLKHLGFAKASGSVCYVSSGRVCILKKGLTASFDQGMGGETLVRNIYANRDANRNLEELCSSVMWVLENWNLNPCLKPFTCNMFLIMRRKCLLYFSWEESVST